MAWRSLVAIALLFLAFSLAPASAFLGKGKHRGGGPLPTIQSIASSGTSFTSGSSSGAYIGTLTAFLTQGVFGGTYQLSTSGANSGGVCNGTNGAGNASFQIVSGDLQTNGTPAAGTYLICVAASQGGLASAGQAFTITAGHLITATTFCAANGGGNGTSGSPWQAACIQAAVNSAVSGDTVFLSAGNWALPIGSSSGAAVIPSGIHLVGAGSGNTFSPVGNPINVDGSTVCPTSAVNITCIYPSGTRSTTGPGGMVRFSSCSNSSVAHIFFDDSLLTAGGADFAILNFNSCPGPSTVNDVHVLSYNDSTFTQEAQFFLFFSNDVTVTNSVFAAPLFIFGSNFYSLDGVFQANDSERMTVKNSSMYEGGINPIGQDDVVMTGNTFFQGIDGAGNGPAFAPAVGWAGGAIGPGTNSGYSNGSNNWTATNNYFNAPGVFFSLGGGTNDPGGGGGNNGLTVTGNTLAGGSGGSASIDSCIFHYYGSRGAGLYSGCSPGELATSATWASSHVTFVVPTTPNIAAMIVGDPFRTAGFLPVGYNGIWTSTAISCSGPSCTISASQSTALATPASTLGYFAVSHPSEGMQINGTVQNDCSENNTPTLNFAISNNSIITTTSSQLVATGTGIINCFISPSGPVVTQHNNTAINFQASQNYLSSASNLYLSDVNTINPSIGSNFCAVSSIGFAGCNTSGFTTPPTVSFTIGLLTYDAIQAAYVVPFASTNFTAQFGAVEWIASASPATPGPSDTRWSFVPPVYLSGTTHGNTIYMWVKDSNAQISPPVTAVIP